MQCITGNNFIFLYLLNISFHVARAMNAMPGVHRDAQRLDREAKAYLEHLTGRERVHTETTRRPAQCVPAV